MSGAHKPPLTVGTRWPRTGLVIAAALTALGALGGLMRADVLAVSLVFTGDASQLSTSQLSAADIGLGMGTVAVRSTGGQDSQVPVLHAGFASAKLDGLCVSHTASVAGQQVTIAIRAGDGTLGRADVKADNAVIDALTLDTGEQSGVEGNGINLGGLSMLGVAASDITTTSTDGQPDVNPLDSPGGTGWYGIDADEGRLYAVRGRIHDARITGPLALPGLRITTTLGASDSCDNTALPR